MNDFSCCSSCSETSSAKIFSLGSYVPYSPGYGHTFGEFNPFAGGGDSCGCYCSKDMEVASQGGPGGLPMYRNGQIVYENKKCGGYYVSGDLNLDGTRNWIPVRI